MSEVEPARPQGALQRVTRTVFSCIPGYEPTPATPNIDKLRELFNRFKGDNTSNADHSVLDRVDSHELCQWSEKILQYLPSVEDSQNTDESSKQIVEHFTTIKKFYKATKDYGVESESLDLLFNCLQIYECVMSIAFVVLKDHPDVTKTITSKISEAIDQINGRNAGRCCSFACFAAALLSQFNKILRIIDDKIGKLGIVGVAEFFAKIIEVFCRFFNIDANVFQSIVSLGDSLMRTLGGLSGSLGAAFKGIPSASRQSKYSPLDVTLRIKEKLAKFETPSKIVGRTVGSFENFYQAIEKVDGDLVKLKQQDAARQQTGAAAPAGEENYARVIASNNSSAYEQLNTIGGFFKQLEAILSYGVLIFKNEDEILNPLLDQVDECTRILKSFFALHPLYKVLCGVNYLSKLKVCMQKIVQVLGSSRLQVNNPREFLAELSKTYPNLLGMLCETIVGDVIKNRLPQKLPEPVEHIVNDAINNGINTGISAIKNRFGF